MPDEASVLEYINSCAVPPSLRDITRAFEIRQGQRASMRQMLRDLGVLHGDDVAISDREIRLPGWDQPLSFRDDPGFDDYR